MDAALKRKMINTFYGEYYQAQKDRHGRLWKLFDKVSDKFGSAFPGFKGIPQMLGLTIIATTSFVGFALVFPFCLMSAARGIVDAVRAGKALERDVESGALSERYAGEIDSCIKMARTVTDDLITLLEKEKSQLPSKGTATASFSATVTGGADIVPAAPAPVAQNPPYALKS